jgi:hypothetical protein
MQIRRQRDTSQTNTHIRRPCSTQHPKRTICRHTIIQQSARICHITYQQERIKAAQDHGLAPPSTGLASNSNCIRSASGSTLSQHTNDQRAEAAHSMRPTGLQTPPSRKTCLQQASQYMPPSVPVERRASQLIQLVGLCTFATADRTDVQTPRDLLKITPANAKRQAGGRRRRLVQTCIEIDSRLSRCTPAHTSQQAACRTVEDGPHLGGDAI